MARGIFSPSISFWAEVGAPGLGEREQDKEFYKIQTKWGQLFDFFCFRKINTGLCKSKNKVFPLSHRSGVGKDQWRDCGALKSHLAQRFVHDLEMM